MPNSIFSQLLRLSEGFRPDQLPRLGWKAEPSSRAEGASQGGNPRKGEEAVKVLNLAFFALVFSVTYRREKLFFSIFSHLQRLSAQQAAEPLWDVTFRGL